MFFSKLICHFLLICFQVHLSKFSARSDKFFLSYELAIYLRLHFLSGHSAVHGLVLATVEDDSQDPICAGVHDTLQKRLSTEHV